MILKVRKIQGDNDDKMMMAMMRRCNEDDGNEENYDVEMMFMRMMRMKVTARHRDSYL